MAGWSSKDRKLIQWDGNIQADSFIGDGSQLTGLAGGGDMTKAVYDPANVSEQLTGLTAVQTLTNKTLTTPTIVATGWTNANHTHAGATTGGQISHTSLTNIGTNTHAQIDTHIASTAIHNASAAITVIFNGGGSVIASGSIIDVIVPFNCKIVSATILPNVSGNITVEIWKDTYANFPPTIADTIISGGIILSASTKFQDNTLTSWNTVINAGDTLRFNVSGASGTLTIASVIIGVIKS